MFGFGRRKARRVEEARRAEEVRAQEAAALAPPPPEEPEPPPPARPERVETPRRRIEVPPSAAPLVLRPYGLSVQIGTDVKFRGQIHETHVESAVVGLRDVAGADRSVCWRLHQEEFDRPPRVDVRALADRVAAATTLLELVDAFADALVEEAAAPRE